MKIIKNHLYGFACIWGALGVIFFALSIWWGFPGKAAGVLAFGSSFALAFAITAFIGAVAMPSNETLDNIKELAQNTVGSILVISREINQLDQKLLNEFDTLERKLSSLEQTILKQSSSS